jgi:hypothetical protein
VVFMGSHPRTVYLFATESCSRINAQIAPHHVVIFNLQRRKVGLVSYIHTYIHILALRYYSTFLHNVINV